MATVISHFQVEPAGKPAEISLPLTLFDMPWLFYFRIMRRLMFYKLPISKETFLETIIPKLINSLSLTLKHFLPLAGNLVSNSPTKPKLRYETGDSVSVAFAETGADFNSLIGNHPRDVSDFYPFVPKLRDGECKEIEGIVVVPVLAVKVTIFPGFGFCIGTTHHHVVGDGNVMIRFTKAWAMINKLSGDAEFLAKEKSVPFYDRTIVRDLYGTGERMFQEKKKQVEVEPSEEEISTPQIDKVRATFIMPRKIIEKLKNLVTARQRPPNVVHVSAYTVTCAYVWTSLLKAGEKAGEKAGGKTEEDKMWYFCCVADIRNRLNPPFPTNYFGNCVTGIYAKSRHGVLVGSEGFLTAAELIGEEIQKRVNDEEWLLSGEFWLSEFKEADRKRTIGVAGYPRMDIYAADFGWGKPEKVEFISIDGGNSMSICKCRDSESDLEVGLAMPRSKMDAFAAIFADGHRNL